MTISERIRPTGFLDPIAQITEVAEGATPGDDHYFRLGVPDRPTVEGAIEVDRTGHGYPVLRILASGIFEDDPGVLGTAIGIGLAESGVDRAVLKLDLLTYRLAFYKKPVAQLVKIPMDNHLSLSLLLLID